ncbi:hypothetical protein FACS189444_3430 [Spirochaetia bacterium]|nr:hypothetical protein FACS189444_3430 [Spirochaetia bacterium]
MIKPVFSFAIFTLIIVAIGLNLGILQNTSGVYGAAMIRAEAMRYNLGMSDPNNAALFIFGTFIALVLLFCNKYLRVIIIMLLTPIALFVFAKTGSKTFFAAWFVFCLLYFMRKYIINRFTIKIIKIIPIILLFSLLFIIFNIEKFRFIDFLLTGRVKTYHQLVSKAALIDYIIGNPFLERGDETIIIDSFYIRYFFQGGIIFFFIIQYLYYHAMNYYYINDKKVEILVLIVYLLYGITTTIGVYVFTNIIFWILLSVNTRYTKEIRK